MEGRGANNFIPRNELSEEGERIPFSIFSPDLADSNGQENEWGEGFDPQPSPPPPSYTTAEVNEHTNVKPYMY